MKYSVVILAFVAGLVAAAPAKTKGGSIIEQLQATFDRNNPNGTPANGSPDDLNGDGVINQFEADASIAKRQNKGGKNSGTSIIEQLQATFDRNNPNGTPANGSPDDLNGDGVINQFEADASIARRQNKGSKNSGSSIVEQLQATFDRNNPNGTPAAGSPDDLNGDGVINVFEANAAAD